MPIHLIADKQIRRSCVLGFLFNDLGSVVMLLKKQRPDWQKNLYSGVGGKIEPGETSHAAMVRECKEEAGVVVPEWRYFAHFDDLRGYSVDCFTVKSSGALTASQEMTDECVCHFMVSDLHLINTVPPVKWLVPMALGVGSNSYTIKEVA